MDIKIKNRKLLFVVSSLGNIVGGHFYSLKDVAEHHSSIHEVSIVIIGKKIDIDFSKSITVYHIPLSKNFLGFIYSFKRFLHIVNKMNPEIIFAFDKHSYIYARISNLMKHNKIALTKCGGPNPRGYFPIATNLIVFSQENYNYFVNKNGYNHVDYIPNRVIDFDTKEYIKTDYIKLLKITRINRYYEMSIKESIRLNHEINKIIKCKLILVGQNQDQRLYNDIKNDQYVILKTENEDIINARKWIGDADIVIATGRSAMEALIKRKIVMVPSKDGKNPVLVTNNNIEALHKNNFSERSEYNGCEIDALFINRITDKQGDINKEYIDRKILLDDIDYSEIDIGTTSYSLLIIKDIITHFIVTYYYIWANNV